MTADIASAMPDRKELMLAVAPQLVPAENLSKIQHVDEVLNEHGEKRRQVDHAVGESHACYAVTSADAHHKSVELRIVIFQLTFTCNENFDVVRSCLCTVLAVFDDLGNRTFLALRCIEHVVADDEHIGIVDGAQVRIDLDPAAVGRFENLRCFAGDVGAFDACTPDDGGGHTPCNLAGLGIPRFDKVFADFCNVRA